MMLFFEITILLIGFCIGFGAGYSYRLHKENIYVLLYEKLCK